mmetsp:Transcript_32074/g.62726  ORF Transcript_32074/g.62726 Transcript_32074/m.62726 type:complete len:212 (+) Transcript_32074:2370-3005(+)
MTTRISALLRQTLLRKFAQIQKKKKKKKMKQKKVFRQHCGTMTCRGHRVCYSPCLLLVLVVCFHVNEPVGQVVVRHLSTWSFEFLVQIIDFGGDHRFVKLLGRRFEIGFCQVFPRGVGGFEALLLEEGAGEQRDNLVFGHNVRAGAVVHHLCACRFLEHPLQCNFRHRGVLFDRKTFELFQRNLGLVGELRLPEHGHALIGQGFDLLASPV